MRSIHLFGVLRWCAFVLALAVISLLGTGLASQTTQTQAQTKTKINPKDGAVMVYVPAGEFTMGSTETEVKILLKQQHQQYSALKRFFEAETPQHKVTLDGYWIYKNDVTVAQYHKFCRETKRKMPPPPPWGWKDRHPIVNVSWYDAIDYCRWAGVRLPTEAEWEKAARGTDGRIFPWGNAWDASRCANSVGTSLLSGTKPVGSYPSGASPYSCLDMAGNLFQWCADWYAPGYYKSAPGRNPTGPTSGHDRVVRGGSWGSDGIYDFRAAYRGRDYPFLIGSVVGFRCASGE